MEKHVSLIAALHIGLSVLGLLIAGLIFFVLIGTGVIAQDEDAFLILTIIGTVTFGFMVITSIPAIIGGIGLLKYRSWARILIMIISAIDLLNIPFGTALGAYSLWVLLQDDTEKLFKPAKAKK
ncbi:hypothetical protein JXO52_03465 [bacterium]|nr:hypothetical protein [bacterium]